MTSQTDLDKQFRSIPTVPETERKSLIRNTIDNLLSEPEERREEQILRNILYAADQESETHKLFSSAWLEVLIELPHADREEYLVSRAKISAKIPEDIGKRAFTTTREILADWPDEKRDEFIEHFESAYRTANLEVPDFKRLLGQ